MTEFFAGPASADCTNLPTADVTWKGPFRNAQHRPTAIGSYQTGVGTPCAQANHVSNAPFSVAQENGASTAHNLPRQQPGWYDLAKFNAVDCILNWANDNTHVDQSNTFQATALVAIAVWLLLRDYRVNGKGTAVVADVVNNQIIKTDTAANTVVGDISARWPMRPVASIDAKQTLNTPATCPAVPTQRQTGLSLGNCCAG